MDFGGWRNQMGECEMSRNGFPDCEREYNKREEAVEMARKDQLDEQGRLDAMGQEREARLMAELAEVKQENLKLSALVVERDYQITLANKGYDYEGAVEDARHYKEVAAALREELAEAKRQNAGLLAAVDLDYEQLYREAIAHPVGNAPMNAIPQNISEWISHLDLHLTEHDERHAGLALRAAWPSVKNWIARLRGDYVATRNRAEQAEAELKRARTSDEANFLRWQKAESRALAAEKDAGRYRWLRDKSVPPHNFDLSVPVEFDGIRYTPQEVDAAIDAAIGAKHEG